MFSLLFMDNFITRIILFLTILFILCDVRCSPLDFIGNLYLLRCGTRTCLYPVKNLICSVFRIFKFGGGCSKF